MHFCPFFLKANLYVQSYHCDSDYGTHFLPLSRDPWTTRPHSILRAGFGPLIPALIFVRYFVQQNIFSYYLIFAAKSSLKENLMSYHAYKLFSPYFFIFSGSFFLRDMLTNTILDIFGSGFD